MSVNFSIVQPEGKFVRAFEVNEASDTENVKSFGYYLHVGADGDVKVTPCEGADDVIFHGMKAGEWIPLMIRNVKTADAATTASGFTAIY